MQYTREPLPPHQVPRLGGVLFDVLLSRRPDGVKCVEGVAALRCPSVL